MNQFFRFIAPRNLKGGVVSVLLFMFGVGIFEVVFLRLYDGEFSRNLGFYIAHSMFVGAPFIVLFVVGSGHQLRLIRRLSLLSRKDGLTGLNNRRTFMELAQKRLDMSGRGILVLLDADHFKHVNDEFGHSVGDRCLEEIAHRIKWNLKADDVAGRLGGEEFAIFFAGATIEQARVIGGRIGQPIPFRAPDDNRHLSITLSMGAVPIDLTQSLDTHLIRADDALYRAKDEGRARMIVWSDDMTSLPTYRSCAIETDSQSVA